MSKALSKFVMSEFDVRGVDPSNQNSNQRFFFILQSNAAINPRIWESVAGRCLIFSTFNFTTVLHLLSSSNRQYIYFFSFLFMTVKSVLLFC